MQPEITPLDPADDATVEAVLDLQRAATASDVPDLPPPCPYAFRGWLTHPRTSVRREFAVARRDGVVAGLLVLELPLKDNLDLADTELVVHPAHRRRGVGRALYAYQVERLRELGRKRYMASTVAALPDGPPRDDAGGAFAAAMGAKVALEEVRRRLDLTVADAAALAAMEQAAQDKAAGYRLVTWQGRTPDEYVADIAYLVGRFVTDAPMGDLQVEPEQYDASRVREQEEATEAGQLRPYSAAALHEDSGRLVAVTTIGRKRSIPWHAFQWITLVDPAHRGRRLGALTKVGNLRHAREQEPELQAIDTWNAAVNQHMIAINEEMGFRTVDTSFHWQQEV